MKEIFLNSVKCAYAAVLQTDLLITSGLVSAGFLNDYFHNRDYDVFESAFSNIVRCLNFKKCPKIHKTNVFSDYDYEDAYGNVYNAGEIYDIFSVKHKDGWYEEFWSCAAEGKEGINELIKKAIDDITEYEEKMDKRREIFWNK